MKTRLQLFELNDVPKGLDYKEIKKILREIKDEQGPVQVNGNDLFFKKGEAWSHNSKEELLYQYRWLKKSRRIDGISVPKPFVFFKIGDIGGYIMEKINGKTLEELINVNKTHIIKNLSDIFKQIKTGIHILHKNGIPHGDIDPKNILLDNNGKVFLIDPYKHENTIIGKLDDRKKLIEMEKFFASIKDK
jgi:serine/threonine protein kinase